MISVDIERRVAELLSGPRSLLALDFGSVPEDGSAWQTPPELPRRQPVDPAGTRLAAVAGDSVALLAEVAATVADWQWSSERRARSSALVSDAVALEPMARLLARAGTEHGWWKPLNRDAQQRLAVEHAAVGPGDPDGDVTAPSGAYETSADVGGVPGEAFWDWDGGLVERYPGVPSYERGRRWHAMWDLPDLPVVTPDWQAVAADWDGVHLTVGGWLTARSRPVVLGAAYTLLEGWETERTVWLNRVTGSPRRVPDYAGPIPYWDA